MIMDIYFQSCTLKIVQMQLYHSKWIPFYINICLQEYLKRYGYIDVLQKSGLQAVVSTSKALKKLQEKLGLEETGSLDQPTIDAMKQPRCGVPDIRNYQTFEGDLKWDHTDVTYRWDIICTQPLPTTTLLNLIGLWWTCCNLLHCFDFQDFELFTGHGSPFDRWRLCQSFQSLEWRYPSEVHTPLWWHCWYHDLLWETKWVDYFSNG